MNANIISECHSLEIIPISRLSRFARIGSRVVFLALGGSDDAKEIPGTLKVSVNDDNGVVKKKITYDRADVTTATTDRLSGYASSRVIATYVDESGNRRVTGSPDYPLTFKFSIAGGAYSCILEGADTVFDGFL